MSQVLVARVKNVLSGDTVVLVPTKSGQLPVPERVLTLAYVRSGDSWKSRDFLRQLVIGKEVKFRVLRGGAGGAAGAAGGGREFGDIQSPKFLSLIEYVVEHGMVKLKDGVLDRILDSALNKSPDTKENDFLFGLEKLQEQARIAGKGFWSQDFTEKDRVEMVELSDEIIAKSKQAPISLVVEKVISGDRIVGRLILNGKQHLQSVFLLGGVRCPRTDDATQAASVTKVAHQAKNFVEDKLLTTLAAIRATIVEKLQQGVPIVMISHPSGNNIHEKLLENGFGEIVDWQSTFIGSSTMSVLRKAEQKARALGHGLYFNSKATPAAAAAAGAAATVGNSKKANLNPGSTIENVVVVKIVSADTLVISLPSTDEELTVQLASVRSPKPADRTVTQNELEQQALVRASREFVRANCIGKTGTLYIDGHRAANKELGLDERLVVSFKIGGYKDLSELVVQNGAGTVVRHNKATLNERAINWDRLIELEEEQKKLGQKGVFYKGKDLLKILNVSNRIIDASENASKSKTFFNGFKQKGKISSGFHVEFVSSLNRFKLFNPKEGLKLTLIMGGLANDKTNPMLNDGIKFLNRKFLQRNVAFEVYDMDKVGGFIGNVYANGTALDPVQVLLLEKGFVLLNERSAEFNPVFKRLAQAEDEAKAAKKGVWAHYDEAAEHQRDTAELSAKLNETKLQESEPQYFDIAVADVSSSGVISFHDMNPAVVEKFTDFKRQFHNFHSQPASASTLSTDVPHDLSKPPKKNDLVSVKFDENGKYYRGKVLGYDKPSRLFEVKHIDFGLVDTVPLASLRSLPAKFNLAAFPLFAHSCVLQSLSLPPQKPKDYLTQAFYALEDLTFDKKLVASVLPCSTPEADYYAILYDAEQSVTDPSYSINKQLVAEGWAIVSTSTSTSTSTPNLNSNPRLSQYLQGIRAAQKAAKTAHLGCWEFGDVSFDEDPLA